ncbi:MAG: hypothetical protein LBC51_08860 [Treponema sp.]|jgi:hypothetical protein|nr:hypothetical protein [Treponema sp.]
MILKVDRPAGLLHRLGLAVLVLALGLVVGACDSSSSSDDEGNVCSSAGLNESGTYTRSGNSATLTQGSSTFGSASISGNTLMVTLTSGTYSGGTGGEGVLHTNSLHIP